MCIAGQPRVFAIASSMARLRVVAVCVYTYVCVCLLVWNLLAHKEVPSMCCQLGLSITAATPYSTFGMPHTSSVYHTRRINDYIWIVLFIAWCMV